MKRGDLYPHFRGRVLDGTTGQDLSTAVGVKFIMRDSSGTVVVDDAAIVEDDDEDGWVRYEWSSGDTDEAGNFDAEVEVEWVSGKPQTFPPDRYVKILIVGDLG
jgi:hypothetical protein